ncbi:MAG TPA: peptidoglycan-binding domain-containing protein [Saliniramus sp.]|nr:peptidoglycan-binding domain-containing protein [Saliniramus sp.]
MAATVAPSFAQGVAPIRIPGPAMLAEARAAFEALDEATRMAIQEALIWTGDYLGAIDGEFGPRTYDAIVSHQRRERLPPNGVLLVEDIDALLAIGAAERDSVGFALIDDPRTGVRIGVPLGLMERRADPTHGGARWQTPDERVTLDTRIFAPGEAELAGLFERLTGPSSGRQVTYKLLRDDFLVVSGETSGGKFYIRHDLGDAGIRGFTLGYDKALASEFDRLALAVAGSFEAYPRRVAVTPKASPFATSAPAPYGTGLVVARDTILTSANLDACRNLRAVDQPVTDRRRADAVLLLTATHGREPLPVTTSPTSDERVVVLAFLGGLEGIGLRAIPGETRNTTVSAALQAGAAGAPVFARNGALVGLVGDLSSSPGLIAGIAPPADYAMVTAAELLDFVPAGERTGAETYSAGALAEAYAAAVIPIFCDE